uniref:Uncharacterized protein n=1 Tax=Romanomermis culicivorax TaxID=13658 RepID=A0A915KB38_ROMCU
MMMENEKKEEKDVVIMKMMQKFYNIDETMVTAIINGVIYSSTLPIFYKESHQDIIQLELKSPIPLVDPNTFDFGHAVVPMEALSLRRYNPYSGAYRVDEYTGPSIVHILGDWGIEEKYYGVLINESTFSATKEHSKDTRYVLTTASCIQMYVNYYVLKVI